MPEMYHHFLRRSSHIANPVLQILAQHWNQYKDDPAAPPPSIPTSGHPSLNWRLLREEAARAARDVELAPHFALVMLSSFAGTQLPIPSLRIFNLSTSEYFSLVTYTLASPQVFPPSHPSYEAVYTIIRQTFVPTLDLLRTPQIPFWQQKGPTDASQPSSGADLSLQEARTFMLALYPHSSSTGEPTPSNPTLPHPSPTGTHQRTDFLASLAIKFSSPAIILQTLSALSPGGPPRSEDAISLEDILFELGETLTQDEGTVEAVIRRWWGPYLFEGEPSEVSKAVTEEAGRTVAGIFEGLHDHRAIDLHGVVKGMCAIVSQMPNSEVKSTHNISGIDQFCGGYPLIRRPRYSCSISNIPRFPHFAPHDPASKPFTPDFRSPARRPRYISMAQHGSPPRCAITPIRPAS